MTKNEFWENITSWSELREFCSDYQCECCDDIYDEYEMDEEIDSDVHNYCRDYSWQELRDMLWNIPQGCDYYRKLAPFNCEGVDEMFEYYKSDVSSWADDNEIWDEEAAEDEECGELDTTEEDSFPDDTTEDEDFSVGDLIDMCSTAFTEIQNDNMHKVQEENEIFKHFVDQLNVLK